MADGKTEVRVEVPIDELRVLDGYCSGTGKHRTDVIREMLAEWSAKKRHEVIILCRVAGINPFEPESGRN
jgi:hypothetical protein